MTSEVIERRRILILISQLGYAGAESDIVRLADFLSEFHNVTMALFTRHYGGAYIQAGSTPKCRLALLDEEGPKPSVARRWWIRWRKLRALKKENDACISFLSGPNLLNALTGNDAAKILFVAGTVHYASETSLFPRIFYSTILNPIAYRLSDAIVPIASWLYSMRAARRRLRYETWYYLHLYTYLAIALAFSHQFADGTTFLSNLAARFWWSAMYLTVAALIAWYRLAVPLLSFARHGFHVIGVKQEGPGVVSVYIGGDRLDELGAEPGQFFRWRFLTRSMWWSSHPYSLSAAPGEDVLRITAKDLGDHSAALAQLRPGTRVVAEGPYGAFRAPRPGRGVVLLAGGVGITPLRALFATLPGPVTLIYRARNPRDVVFREELDAIAAARGAIVHYVIGSRAEMGGDPLSPRVLRSLAPALDAQDVYVCGPPGMTSAAVKALRAAGVPKRSIHHESFEL